MKVVKDRTGSMPYPILIDGHPTLKLKCAPVEDNSPDLQTIIKRMFATLRSTSVGVGLAASQVGLPVNMFILGGGLEDRVFINPEVITLKGSKKTDMEGCLSVPLVYARVERHQKIVLKYLDQDWKEHTAKFSGFTAKVIQHELDHMEGIEFTERLKKDELNRIQPKLDMIRKGQIPKLEYAYKLKDDDNKKSKKSQSES